MSSRISEYFPFKAMNFLVIGILLITPSFLFAVEGDFDGDGQIGIGDAVVALQSMTGKPVVPPERFTNTVGMTFITIPAGQFTMGSPEDELGRQPDESSRNVTITKSFYLQTTEVTQKQWWDVMGSSPSFFSDCGEDCPVEFVSREDAIAFIQALNSLEGTTSYRLPTEAEWEYAARAGTEAATSAGDLEELECLEDPTLSAIAWYCANAGERPHPVGHRAPNAWGLYDMLGNVWEWTADGYLYGLGSGPVSDPFVEGAFDGYVYRGGGWSGDARTCRSADRDSADGSVRAPDLGFRVVRIR